jgi:hypothetical protein
MTRKWSTNPITSPNPVYSHSILRDIIDHCEMLDSNLGTDSPDWDFFRFSSVPPNEYQDSTLKKAETAFPHIPSHHSRLYNRTYRQRR